MPGHMAAVVALLVAVGLVVGVPLPAHAATATGSLTVVLTDPEQQPLPLGGVTVQLRTPTGATARTATTDAAGRLTFDAVPTDTTYALHGDPSGAAGGADLLPADRADVRVTPDGHDRVVLVVRRGASMSGVVTADRGLSALGRAPVVVRGWNTGTVRRVDTDTAGRWNARGLPSDDYSVQFNAPREVVTFDPYHLSGWSFYRAPGATTERSYVRLAQQVGGRAASVVTGISGDVERGMLVGGLLRPQRDIDFSRGEVRVYGEQIGSSFTTHLTWFRAGQGRNDGGSFALVLEPGRYKVEVTGWSPTEGDVSVWWAGEDHPPVADRASGHTVVIEYGRTMTFPRSR